MRSIGVLLVLVACHGGGTESQDAAVVPDVPQHALGMFVTWNAEPMLPGDLSDKISVSDAVFQLDHLQLVSDAGADDRTTHSRYLLHWGVGTSPPEDAFPDAPVAVYQRISLDMKPLFPPLYAYQIQGTWRGDRGPMPFKIVDPTQIVIPIDCSVALPVGGAVSIAIKVDLDDALENIDFRNVPEQAGMLVLSGGPELGEFRQRLMQAFKLEN